MSRFELGAIVATPAALATLKLHGVLPAALLSRHQCGDWGEVSQEDVWENELGLKHGFRILSSYSLSGGERIWIITEADRASTCLLLPEDY